MRYAPLPDLLQGMARLAVKSADTPLAFILGRRIIRNVPRGAPLEYNALAMAFWLRNRIRFCREQPEALTDLATLLYLGAGDCDDQAIALGALLIRQAFPIRWGVGFNGAGVETHVWCEAYFSSIKRWVPLDTSTYLVDPGTSPVAAGVESVVSSRAYPLAW